MTKLQIAGLVMMFVPATCVLILLMAAIFAKSLWAFGTMVFVMTGAALFLFGGAKR